MSSASDKWKDRLKKYSSKLPDTTKDEYYGTHERRLDTIIGADQSHINQLIAARQEWSGEVEVGAMIQWEKFNDWLQDKYGVKLGMNEGGMLNLDYEVLDEKKYMIFVLKFSGGV